MITIKINPEKIRDVIGKGGSVIRALTEETGTHDRHLRMTARHHRLAPSSEGMAEAKKRIENITAEVEVGKVYEGPVLKMLDFGAIVNILPGKDGLLHISPDRQRARQGHHRLPEGRPDRDGQGHRDGREGSRALSAKALLNEAHAARRTDASAALMR